MKTISRFLCVFLVLISAPLARAGWWTAPALTATTQLLVSTGASTTFTSGSITGVPTPVVSNQTLSAAYINASNPNSTLVYIQFFDSATTGAVTLGTTPPTFFIAVPATANGGVLDVVLPLNTTWVFSKGVVVAATTTPTGNTAPASPATLTFKSL